MLRDYSDRIPPTDLTKRRPWKAYLGDALIIGAIVAFVWSMLST